MTGQDELLDNLLDNLDNLYDRRCSPGDTRYLVTASAVALFGSPWEPLLRLTADALLSSTGSDQEQYDYALVVTNELRLALAADR